MTDGASTVSLPSLKFDENINGTFLRRAASFPVSAQPPPVLDFPSDIHEKTFSLKSDDSDYFVDLFGRLLAQVPPDDDDELQHSLCPQCLSMDEDPFVGILQNQALTTCCPLRAYLDLLPSNSDFKTSFTPYGRRLIAINTLYDIDLRARLAEHWRRNWIALGTEGLHRYMKRFISHMDDDGVTWCFQECTVCAAPCRYVKIAPCCRKAICQECWTSYVRSAAAKSHLSLQMTGMYSLNCFSCAKFVPYPEALVSTEPELLAQIRPPGLLMNSKRCPGCLKPAEISLPKQTSGDQSTLAKLKKLQEKKGGSPIACDRCNTAFCALCGASSHPDVSCSQLVSADTGFQVWAIQKSIVRPQFPNGRFCPSCGIPVSHSGGCPHMVCPCGVHFCYSCGRKHFNKSMLRCLPDHAGSRLIPFVTCPKLWHSQSKRILVHSLITLGLVIGIGPVAVAATPVALPVFLSLYLVRKKKQQRRKV